MCLRYFDVFGPRQNADSSYSAIIPTFIKRLTENLPPVIFGDGRQTRDFVFVKDVVQADILVAESEAEGIYNIGSGKSTSVNELTDILLRLTGKSAKPIHTEARVGETRCIFADISKARNIGYQPKWNLHHGLVETIQYSIDNAYR